MIIKKYFDTEEELCEIDAILIKNKSAKNPGYLHGLNDTPFKLENEYSFINQFIYSNTKILSGA